MLVSPFPEGVVCIYIGQRVHLYEVVAPRRDKSCGRVVEKFWLRTWLKYLRAWIFGLTCLGFKTTCIDRRKPLREDAFSFTRRTLFSPLDKRNTRDKAKGLCITSERHIPQCWIGTRCRGQRFIRRHIASFREREERVSGQIPTARYFALDGGRGLYLFTLLCTFALHKRV